MNSPELDLSTPEKTLHLLEEAYRNNDLELARHCRNFEHEAELVQQHLQDSANASGGLSMTHLGELARALEHQWRQSNRPDFLGVATQVVAVEHHAGKFFVVTQNIRNADGRTFAQRIYMSHSENGWAFLRPVPPYEPPKQAKPWWAVWR